MHFRSFIVFFSFKKKKKINKFKKKNWLMKTSCTKMAHNLRCGDCGEKNPLSNLFRCDGCDGLICRTNNYEAYGCLNCPVRDQFHCRSCTQKYCSYHDWCHSALPESHPDGVKCKFPNQPKCDDGKSNKGSCGA